MPTDGYHKGVRLLGKTMRMAVLGAAALVCAVLIIFAFNIRLNLSPIKDDIAALVKETFGVNITFEGDLILVPGRRPAVEIRELRLRPPNQHQGILRIEYLELGVDIFPLLKRMLRVTEIVARGLGLDLRGFDRFNISPEQEVEFPQSLAPASGTPSKKTPSWRVEVTRIDLRDATFAMSRQASVSFVTFSEISGSATDEDGLKLCLKGTFRDTPLDLAVDGGSLTTLLDRSATWPLGMTARVAGGDIFVGGRIHPLEKRAAFDVRLSGQITPQLEALLGRKVVAFEDYLLGCRLAIADSLLRVTDLNGRLGNTRFTGDGQWNGIEKRLTGSMDVSTLDFGPILRSAYPADDRQSHPANRSGVEREVPFTLPDVASHLDVDLHLAVDQIVGIPGELRNATARLVIGDGRATLPLFITVYDTPIGGEATLSLDEEVMTLSVGVAADKTDLGRMAGEWGIKVAGRLGELTMSASASGGTPAELLQNLAARLEIRNADVAIDAESARRPMRVALDAAMVRLPAGGAVQGICKGKLLGEPFSLNLVGGGMRDILEKSIWPVDLRFVGAGAKLRLSGTILPLGDSVGPELTLRLSGDRIGALAVWTGISPSAAMPYTMDAAGSLNRKKWHLEVRQLTLGRSTLSGAIGAEFTTNKQPKTVLSVHSDLIDGPQLKTLFFLSDATERAAYASERPDASEGDTAHILDRVIFSNDFHLPEMDVNLNMRRVLTEKLSYRDCFLEVSIRRDRSTTSRFKFGIGESAFNGQVILDLVQQPPLFGLRVSTNRFELGELLEAFDVVKGVDAGVKTLEINVTARGRRLSDLILSREIVLRAQNGRWLLEDSHAAIAIRLDSAEYADRPGEPFQLDVHGQLKDSPLKMRWLVQKKLSEGATRKGRSFEIEVEVSGTRLELTGNLIFPLRRRGEAHRFHLSADRLSRLSPLLNLSLPPLGPFEVSGVIRIQPEAYLLSDADLSVGGSRLLGRIRIVTEGPRPKVEANLEAKTIQLQDFDFDDQASLPGDKESTAGTQTGRNSDRVYRREQFHRLLDPSVGGVIDADISIQVAEVLAGDNRLGNGILRVLRDKNRLSISPLTLSIPGGDVDIEMDLDAINGGVMGALKVDVRQLDFGPLLRLKDPHTQNSGHVSLIIDLKSTADSISALLAQATGRVAVSIQPENIKAGELDFWAVNLLTALLPVINPNNESKINCIVADLDMDDGLMKEKAIVIDTSKIRVRGAANVDFKKQTVYLNLKPTPKRPQFISLATPVEVRGTFSDFGVRVAPGSLIGTVIRVLTAHIVVPIQWIILNKLPEDGSDVCRDTIENCSPCP